MQPLYIIIHVYAFQRNVEGVLHAILNEFKYNISLTKTLAAFL